MKLLNQLLLAILGMVFLTGCKERVKKVRQFFL